MRGSKRGRRGGKSSHTIIEEYYYPNSPQSPSPSPSRSPLAHPIASRTRLGAANSSPASPSPASMSISNSKAAKDNTLSASPTSPAIIQSSRPQVYVDVECATNFAPTYSHCFSSFGSVNITECAQKLREEMEDDPEEEVESAPEPGFVYVHDLRVKIEYAPLVEAIFERYGDITKGSDNKSSAILSMLLEHVCVVCSKLKGTNFSDVTCIELEKMLTEVGDLERQKMNVGWLREKIEHIIRAKVDFGRYLDVKEDKIEHDKRIERIEEELREEKVKSDDANKLALDIKTRVAYHKTHSLLHGLF